MKVGIYLGVCNNPPADFLHCECTRRPVIPHHHNPASTYNKERAAKPGENGLKWLKWVKMDGASNVPHPQCTRSIKRLVMEQQTCERAKAKVQVAADVQNSALDGEDPRDNL